MSRILVIDDEDLVREVIVEILEREGYDVVGAETPQEALALLEEGNVCLIVSDIIMPGLSGFELLETVRARQPGLPVIFVTGAGTEENLAEALARGAYTVIVKPFSHAELRAAIAAERARGLAP